MEVSIIYQAQQFDEAVKYVSQRNVYFKYQDAVIKRRLKEVLREVALDSRKNMISTMGFRVYVVHRRYEGINSDKNTCSVDILVDPALGLWDYDSKEEIVTGEMK